MSGAHGEEQVLQYSYDLMFWLHVPMKQFPFIFSFDTKFEFIFSIRLQIDMKMDHIQDYLCLLVRF